MSYSLRLLFVLIIALVFVACSNECVVVPGAQGQFCVPASQKVNRVAWLPEGIPDDGFAFSGCLSEAGESIDGCQMPAVVQGGFVVPIQVRDRFPMSWDSVEGSTLHHNLQQKDAIFQSVMGGKMVIASNPKMGWNWYVWLKRVPVTQGEPVVLESEDTLLLICTELPNHKSLEERRLVQSRCQRRLDGPDYSLGYSVVVVDDNVPYIDEIDSALFSEIELWRR